MEEIFDFCKHDDYLEGQDNDWHIDEHPRLPKPFKDVILISDLSGIDQVEDLQKQKSHYRFHIIIIFVQECIGMVYPHKHVYYRVLLRY